MRIKSLIIEDELYIRKGLLSMLGSLDINIDILGECESVKDAVVVAHACKPDLIFLDINLTDGTAFDFLEQTKTLTFKVIFITAYDQYALQALKNGAVDYILKPIDIEELEEALAKVISETSVQKEQFQIVENQLLNNQKDRLILRLQDEFQVIEFKYLEYCQSDKGYTSFYLSNGKSYMASKPIKEFESQLPTNNFIRTHQSFIVNMDYIDKYDKNGYVILKSDTKIPVSSRKKEFFISKLLKG